MKRHNKITPERQRRSASKAQGCALALPWFTRRETSSTPNGVAPFASAIARGRNPDGVLGSPGTVTQGSRSLSRGNPGLHYRTPLAFFVEHVRRQ